MAKRATHKRRVRNKKGSYMLPFKPLDPNAIFTMVLSCETFITKTLKKQKIKVDSKVLLEKISAAVLETVYATEAEKPIYNVAADALAAAYLTFKRDDKVASRDLVTLAFESPDCETLLSALVKVNEQAAGTKLVADEMNDDIAPDPDAASLDTGGGLMDNSGYPQDGPSSTSPELLNSTAKVLKKKIKKHIRAARDNYEINYGIDTPEGETSDDDLDTFIDDGAEELLEVEPLGGSDDSIPDTMRLGVPTDINQMRPRDDFYELPEIKMTAKEIARLARKNPQVIKIANKIATSGKPGADRMAHRFMRVAVNQ